MSGESQSKRKRSASRERELDARIEQARQHFAQPPAHFEPGPDFVARVTTQLQPRTPSVQLGWVAVRMLPVSLALVLGMSWVAFQLADDSVVQGAAHEAPYADSYGAPSGQAAHSGNASPTGELFADKDEEALATPSQDLFAWVLEREVTFENFEAGE